MYVLQHFNRNDKNIKNKILFFKEFFEQYIISYVTIKVYKFIFLSGHYYTSKISNISPIFVDFFFFKFLLAVNVIVVTIRFRPNLSINKNDF